MNPRYIIEVQEHDADRIRIALSSSGFHNTTIKVGMGSPIPVLLIREADE